MPHLSDQQIAAEAQLVGLHGAALIVSVAVALAESSGSVDGSHVNANGSTDYGLWQINHEAHPAYAIADLKTAHGNALAMLEISSGGTDWTPWSVYKNGRYKAYLSRARAAVKVIATDDPDAQRLATQGDDATLLDELKKAGGAAVSVSGAGSAVAAGQAIARGLNGLVDGWAQDAWLIGIGLVFTIGAVALVVIGLWSLAKPVTQPLTDAAGAAAKAAAVA